MILDIWNSGYGVATVHTFHSVIPVEAYTREACMIEAMSKCICTLNIRLDSGYIVQTFINVLPVEAYTRET